MSDPQDSGCPRQCSNCNQYCKKAYEHRLNDIDDKHVCPNDHEWD